MEARLPDDKLQKCNAQLLDMHRRRKTTLKELQSLIGLLNFTCSVVLPGRAFLRRLVDLTKGVRLPRHRIRITEACRRDLLVWLQFLRDFNGRTFFSGRSVAGFTASQPLHRRRRLKGLWRTFWETLVLRRMACQLEIIEHCIFRALSDYYLAPRVGMSHEQ